MHVNYIRRFVGVRSDFKNSGYPHTYSDYDVAVGSLRYRHDVGSVLPPLKTVVHNLNGHSGEMQGHHMAVSTRSAYTHDV